jgi:hypothetical protein
MKIVQPGGHLDQMMRQTRNHHVALSSMADTKANMLITTSSVLITLSAPYVLNPHFKGAVIILAICCLMTIVLAIYTLMPKLRNPKMPPDVHSPRFNLLFFGDFTRLEYSEFEAAMEEVMNDASLTYQAQVRELYTLGQFLATRKYRTLRLAYFSFIFGLLASTITLMIGLQF